MKIDYGSAGVAFAIAGYVVFVAGIWINNLKLNAVTFLLYVILNGITVVNIRALGGNTFVLYIYTLGSAAVFLSLLLKKMLQWTWVESLISALVAICLLIWLVMGQSAAVYAGSISSGLASVPLMASSWDEPDPNTTGVWTIFLLANISFFLAGKDWSPEQVAYPLVASFCNIIVIAINLRKGIAGSVSQAE